MFQLGEEGPTVEDGERAAAEGESGTSSPRRERPMPLERCLRWSPVKLELSGNRVSPAHPIFVAQVALRELQRHILTGGAPERWGLLVGRLLFCPRAEVPYVVADGVRVARSPLPEEADIGEAVEVVRRGIGAAEAAGETVVGWYHSHSALGAFLSERDAAVHTRCFVRPWQFAVVGVADSLRPAGGVFARTEWGAMLRGAALPFYELLDADALLPDGRKLTCLEWVNYSAREQAIERAAAEPGEGPEPPPLPPLERAEGADAAVTEDAAVAKDAAVVEGAIEGEGETASPDRLPEPDAAPPGGSEAGIAENVPAPGGASELERGSPRSEPAAAPAWEPVRETGEVPVLIPDGEESVRALRWVKSRPVATAGLSVLVLALGAWFAFGLGRDGGASGPPSAPARVVPTAAPSTEFAAPASPVSPGRATGSPGAPSFDRALALFRTSVSSYRDLIDAFGAGRIGCAALGSAYARTDEAFLDLSERYAELREEVEALGVRYRAAADEMDAIDRHFDASGCPRPR